MRSALPDAPRQRRRPARERRGGARAAWCAPLLCALALEAHALTFTTEEAPPLNFSPDDGKTVTGLSTDLLREAAKRAGLPATFVLLPWKRAYLMAQNSADTCVYSTVRTEAREPLFKWIGPLAPDTWTVFAKAGSPIVLKALADIRNYRIGGYQGDSRSIYLKNLGFTVDEATNETQNVRKLQAGRIDLWIATSMTGPWIARAHGVAVRPALTIRTVEVYAACNPALPDAEVSALNAALRRIRADGTYERILRAYLKHES